MADNVLFTNVITFIQACAGLATAVALYFIIKTYNHNKDKRQFELAKDVQDNLVDFSKELLNVEEDEDRKLAVERLFNTLEWLGFLINEKQITNRKIILYFKKSVIQYYENTFLTTPFISSEQKNDATEYVEFKKLVQSYKECKYD